MDDDDRDDRDSPLLSWWGRAVVLAWLIWLVWSLLRLCRLARRERVCPGGQTVPPWAYRQPDPLLYSQPYLQSLGLAVTWDNPDIQVELPSAPGVAVDKHALLPDTVYDVVTRVWNGSNTAPAVGLPVHVSYLSFGIGTTRTDVGTTNIDLGARGSADCPSFARVVWRTPALPGHYCLQSELIWSDDANPANNLGQSNTDVKPLNSPHAAFTFPVRNDAGFARRLRLEADGYAIPPLEACEERDRRRGLGRHERAAWPTPPGWTIAIDAPEFSLAAGESRDVTVDITSPDGYRGRQGINVNAFDGRSVAGGVTLYVDGNG